MLLTAEAAQRMATATRRVEKIGVDVPPGEWHPYVPDEAFALRLVKTKIAWPVGTWQTLDEYIGEPGAAVTDPAWPKVRAWNGLVSFPAGVDLFVGHVNGHYRVLVFSYTQVAGYSGARQQILGHGASGELVWLDTQACP